MQPAISVDEINDHEFLLFKKLIAQHIGVDLPPHKKHLLVNRLRMRLVACRCTSFLQYFQLISSKAGNHELRTALDLMTTNETYFFREAEHFTFLRKWLRSQQLKRCREVRIWSAACSSGEEPYSIAMVLEDYPLSWEVIGSDVNSRMIQTAKDGIYLDRRTEGMPNNYRDKYCREGTGDYAGYFRICPQLRSRMHFTTQNLTHAITAVDQPVDIIFLRNVMIYFDLAVRKQVVANVAQYLNLGGYLIVSHAESLHGVHPDFRLVQSGVYQLSATPTDRKHKQV